MDTTVAYERYKFLGHEFLTWLWFMIENSQDEIRKIVDDAIEVEIGNRIVLAKNGESPSEVITIKGNDANLEEGMLSLKKGAFVNEISLILKLGDQQWSFSLKGENLNIGSLKTPDTAPVEKQDEVEGAIIDKVNLIEQPIKLIDKLFSKFVKSRIGNEFVNSYLVSIQKWIEGAM
ncbi:MAG: hypothetical protein HQK76_18055 [Desulfobacterales bacterium]|nr:hypothetical protein [Desulfobacterales bacterium]